MTIAAEFPFIRVRIDTSGLMPTAKRATGNIGIVGDAGGFGSAVANVPVLIGSEAEARTAFATTDASGAVTASGRLYESIRTALLQDPAPSRIYAVATADNAGAPDYAAALASLAAAPVQLVSLANETDPALLGFLKDHVEGVSADGDRRIGVAMVDPDLAVAAGETFADEADDAYGAIQSDVSRMVLVAARVTTTGGVPDDDVATAGMAAMAGYPPHISVLMKQLRGVKIPVERQFSGSEIKQLAEKFIIPIIDPELIPGEGLYLGSARAYTTDVTRLYVDIVRVLDDIEFRLKAGLIGSIGNVRIDRLGMQGLKARFDGILGPLQSARVIDGYSVEIPILPILEAAEAVRTPGQVSVLGDARTSRVVEVIVSVTYAGAVHFLDVSLALKV
jgi:phage tail sheath gpL-like